MSEKFSVGNGVMAVVGLVMLVGIGVRFAGGGDVDETQKRENISTSVEKSANVTKASIDATVDNIGATFANNKLAAKSKFGGKSVTINGFFYGAEQSSSENVIQLASLGMSYDGKPEIDWKVQVWAKIPDSLVQSASGLNSGDLIKITCEEWEGGAIYPSMSQCSDLVVLEPSGYEAATKYLKMINK
jgi:hypothetical protein